MADSQGNNSARLRRNISKIAFRNKERVMRSIGRAEETKDELLDYYVMLMNKQQVQMQKLQRDMKQYLQALKAMSVSQKAFYSSLYEIYDNDWAGKDVVASCSQRNESLYDDIFARFQSEVLELLQNHLSEYQKCKACVEKRGRKLVDFDAAKRTVHALENSKKPDPGRVEKSQENLRQTREIYEELNNFLHQQLPTLYDSRLSVCVNIFSSICESESMFSSEVAELRTKLNTILLNLKSAFDNGEYHIQRMQTPLDNGQAPDTPGSRTAPPIKVPRATEHEVTVHNSDTMPAPRTPSENDVAKPSTDPSTHEYVNLQVGTARDSVKPVSEEEELGSGDTQSNSRTDDEHTYMIPNVPYERRHSEYMMASDLVCLSRRSPPVGMSFGPKPPQHTRIFRNPSDHRNTKPPIPKSLPRALSAPPGRRPIVQKHPKPPRRSNLRFYNLRETCNGSKPLFTTSQDRPKFPPPNDTQRNIESNSEIPPIYEEPPREDTPIHELSSNSSSNLPRLPQNYLFSVQALYKYHSTDDDELSFSKGDIIHIIVHPDPDEQDEGWQMGVRQIDWEERGEHASMGVFPENFTKSIEL